MRILFIGGTGVISSACTREAVRQGHDLYILNRGVTADAAPEGTISLRADIRDRGQVKKVVAGYSFDCVVNWVAFEPEHIRQDVRLFGPLTAHYIFISSASVYLKPPSHWVITEDAPAGNPYWPYAQKKLACEEQLTRQFRENRFPATIVRPSHTYNDGWIPSPLGSRDFTVAQRILDGKEILSPGDGQSLWTITHSNDFARGFTPLLGNLDSIGEIFHITSDEARTWDAWYGILGEALGVEPRIVHVPSEFVLRVSPMLGQGLMGDKAWSMLFDNSKIRRLVPDFKAETPFAEGIGRSLEWFNADPSRKLVDPVRDAEIEKVLKVWKERMGTWTA